MYGLCRAKLHLRTAQGGGIALALLSAACGLETEAPVEDQVGSTHAVVSVERSETADRQSSRAEALAGFLNVPPLVDAESAMSLVGLGLDLPELGGCMVGSGVPRSVPLAETARVEFVDAGDVTLEVNGARERLAPFAFPTVTDSISGVLYTTRDRAADPLPSASRYTVTADGLDIRAAHDAPRQLEGVTASGIPLAELTRVDVETPLDLTWSVEALGDVVYVELVSSKTSSRAVCAFADELGAGSVPTESFQSGDTGQVVVHRLRTHEFGVQGQSLSRGELRFDFALTTSVAFD